jgi:hypothetical protein
MGAFYLQASSAKLNRRAAEACGPIILVDQIVF